MTDSHRRRHTATAAQPDLLRLAETPTDASEWPDQRLALLLACAHETVDPPARAPLMLQTVLGLDASRIASAFLIAPAALSQRLVRAKQRLKAAGARFELPGPEVIAARLPDALAAIYAAYAAGAADPADGGALAEEAAWLARLLAALAPTEPEALGLAALLLHLEARRPAGRDPHGAYVPLLAQDPERWHLAAQLAAETLLRRAAALGKPGRFQWEAAIASAHAARRFTGHTDWTGILALYEALWATTLSPVVAVNRAVALAEVAGVDAGLDALEAAAGDTRLAGYQPFWAARASLLARVGRAAEAQAARERAAGLAVDPAVRAFLLASGEGALPPRPPRGN